MKNCDDHEGNLCGEIHEDDNYEHHRSPFGVSAMTACRIDRCCTSIKIKLFQFFGTYSQHIIYVMPFDEIEKVLNSFKTSKGLYGRKFTRNKAAPG